MSSFLYHCVVVVAFRVGRKETLFNYISWIFPVLFGRRGKVVPQARVCCITCSGYNVKAAVYIPQHSYQYRRFADLLVLGKYRSYLLPIWKLAVDQGTKAEGLPR